MKKLSLLLIMLLMITACTQDYPEEYRAVCKSKRTVTPDKEYQPDDFKKEWITTITFDARDNYIYQSTDKTEYLLKEPALKYLREDLKGDKEALLKEFIDLAVYDNNEFYDNIDKHNIEYLEDRIIVEINYHYQIPTKTWKTLIIPSESNFKDIIKSMNDIGIECEIYER